MNHIQDFVTLFLSIIVESLPYVTIGVLISVLIALFVPENFLLKMLPKNRYISHIILSLVGIVIPVCQCGNIPVARRLIFQGLSPSQAITFLLAAPLLNPITFFTTYQAFSLTPQLAFIRVLSGFFIANIIGIFLSYQKDQNNLLTKSFYMDVCNIHTTKRSFYNSLEIFQSEFIYIAKLLCIGAAIAALIQTFIPKETLLAIGHNVMLSFFIMLLLGFIISICSTVDAFFALSYINGFTLGSILSFLIFGPLVDIKMIILMRSMYKNKVILSISLFIALVSVCIGLLVNQFVHL